MLKQVGATAYINPEEVAAIEAYDSGEPPRADLCRETGALVTLKSGKYLTLKDLSPEAVVTALGGPSGEGHRPLLEECLADLWARNSAYNGALVGKLRRALGKE